MNDSFSKFWYIARYWVIYMLICAIWILGVKYLFAPLDLMGGAERLMSVVDSFNRPSSLFIPNIIFITYVWFSLKKSGGFGKVVGFKKISKEHLFLLLVFCICFRLLYNYGIDHFIHGLPIPERAIKSESLWRHAYYPWIRAFMLVLMLFTTELLYRGIIFKRIIKLFGQTWALVLNVLIPIFFKVLMSIFSIVVFKLCFSELFYSGSAYSMAPFFSSTAYLTELIIIALSGIAFIWTGSLWAPIMMVIIVYAGQYVTDFWWFDKIDLLEPYRVGGLVLVLLGISCVCLMRLYKTRISSASWKEGLE